MAYRVTRLGIFLWGNLKNIYFASEIIYFATEGMITIGMIQNVRNIFEQNLCCCTEANDSYFQHLLKSFINQFNSSFVQKALLKVTNTVTYHKL